MSTPKDPGRKLPDEPATPPSLPQHPAPEKTPASGDAEQAADTRSVLERLKAAQPRTAPPGIDDAGIGPTSRRAVQQSERHGGTTPEPVRASSPSGRSGSSAPEKSTAALPADAERARELQGAQDIEQARRARQADDAERAQETERARALKRAENAERAREARERLRVAAVKAKSAATAAGGAARVTGRATAVKAKKAATAAGGAARATGSALGRGSTATVRHVGSWNEDVVRQVVVTLCAVACIVGSAAGVGAFGGPSIRDAAGGLFAPDATLLAPASSAFSIWGVIYAGLIAYTVFQWLPGQRRSARQRRLGWIIAASMLLNLAWILGAQSGGLTLSLAIIMLLFFTLLAAVAALNEHPTQTRLEGLLVDTPIGLYLGWVLLAAAANGAAYLTAEQVDLFGLGGNVWAIIGIIGVLMTAAVICSTDRGRLSVAAATSWGLLWIGVERALGQPVALDVTFAAALSIFLLLITAGSRRHRVDHAYRRWLRAQEDAQREPLDLLNGDYEDSRY